MGVRRYKLIGVSVAGLIVAILAWQIFATYLIDPLFFPSPMTVLSAARELWSDGTLQEDIYASLKRVILGWLLGSAAAIPLGLIIGTFAIPRSALDPFLHFFRFVPALALVALFVIWFGIGDLSKILLIAYATAFLITVNVASGAASVPRDRVHAARCLGADSAYSFRHVVVPSTFPAIFLGMRLGLAESFLVIVAAEALAAQSGLGFLIWNSRIYFRTDWSFVGIICLGLLGLTCDRLWKLLGATALRRLLGDVSKY